MQVWEFVDVPAVTAKLEPAGPPRCLFLAALIAHHGQRTDPRDGLGQGRGALVCQHALFVSVHAGPIGQLHAALAAAVRDGARADRPLPLERAGNGRRPPAVCDGSGPHRRAGRLAAREGTRRDRDGYRKRRRADARPVDAALAPVACAAGFGSANRAWERSGFIDPRTGRYEAVASTPGFTRGLDFAGDLAFVGLSQVRESAVFSGIPITERLAAHERTCGVCVIDLTRGEPIALLRFEEGVQEVFAVQVLPGRRYPELVNDEAKLLENSFVVPDAALADVPATLRGAAPLGVKLSNKAPLCP